MAKEFEPHMMYGDGEAKKADTYNEHLKLKKKGWGHKKPSPFKMKGYTYPGTSPLKRCWKGYKPNPDGRAAEKQGSCVPE